MDLKKQVAIDAYVKSFGIITKAAAAAEVSRQTFYDWLNNDPEFRAAIETAKPDEYYLDFVEDMLLQLIKQGNTAATIFALKTKGQLRGYIEQPQNIIQTIGVMPQVVVIEKPADTLPPVYDEAEILEMERQKQISGKGE